MRTNALRFFVINSAVAVIIIGVSESAVLVRIGCSILILLNLVAVNRALRNSHETNQK